MKVVFIGVVNLDEACAEYHKTNPIYDGRF